MTRPKNRSWWSLLKICACFCSFFRINRIVVSQLTAALGQKNSWHSPQRFWLILGICVGWYWLLRIVVEWDSLLFFKVRLIHPIRVQLSASSMKSFSKGNVHSLWARSPPSSLSFSLTYSIETANFNSKLKNNMRSIMGKIVFHCA